MRRIVTLSAMVLAFTGMAAGTAAADEPADHAAAVTNCGDPSCEVSLSGTMTFTYTHSGGLVQTCDIQATALVQGYGTDSAATLDVTAWEASGGYGAAGMGGKYACGEDNDWFGQESFDDCNDAGFTGGLFLPSGTAWSSGSNHTAYLPTCFGIINYGPRSKDLSFALNADATTWTLDRTSYVTHPYQGSLVDVEAELQSDTALTFAEVQ